jgi:hypothetical protein
VLWRYVKVWVQEDALGLVARPPRNLQEMKKNQISYWAKKYQPGTV